MGITSGMLSKVYQYIAGGVNPSGAASQSGDMGQMTKWLTANVLTSAAGPLQAFASLPGRRTAPVDVTIAGPTTLTARINYFNNLTVNDNLTGLAGGTIIIVEGTLTIAAGKNINCDALGGKGAAAPGAGPLMGLPGYGGGPLGLVRATGTGQTIPVIRTRGRFLSETTIAAAEPYLPISNELWARAASGSSGAWPAASTEWLGAVTGAATNTRSRISDWALWLEALEFALMCQTDDTTWGGPGGGGGGSGSSGGVGGPTFTSPQPALLTSGGWPGAAALATDNNGGGGGSGIGGGGDGGPSGNAAANGAGGPGSRGGGMLLILCKTLNNAGTIRANGADGGAATGTGANGGGGGGGGGVVGVGYETLTALGTLQANGGAAGANTGTGSVGSIGGAGLAFSFKIRSGV